MPNASQSDHDAVIIGASLAGATTAILLARAGVRVALVEQRPDPDAFKRICGHVSPVFGKLQMPNVQRGPIMPRLALVGDAAVAADPLFGVGCGWAFQSAEWLAQATAPALRGEQSLLGALGRYRRSLRRGLLGHNWLLDEYATGRRLNLAERLIFSAPVRDPRLAARFEAFGTRNLAPQRFLPGFIAHALAADARHRLAGHRAGRRARRQLEVSR